MTILRERIETRLAPEDAFAFVADFANAARWDPGVASSERTNPGPLEVGATYRLGVRMAGRIVPMDYVVTDLDAPNLVVLEGSGRGVRAVDEIRFSPIDRGTRVDYTADIRLVGVLRAAGPFAGGALERIGRAARDGMRAALERRAAGA